MNDTVADTPSSQGPVALLPGRGGTVPKGLVVEPVDVAEASALPGEVGVTAQVSGVDRFEPTILKVAVSDDDLIGVDAATVRVLRYPGASRDGDPALIGASGCSRALGYAWATITESGRYVAAGLPLDPAVGPAATPDGEPLVPDEARGLLAADLAATTSDPELLRQLSRSDGGAGLKVRLPRDVSLAEWRAIQRRDAAARTPVQALLQRAVTTTSARIAHDLPGVPASANWWMYHRDAEHSGVVEHSHITSTTVGGLRLRARIQLDGPVVSVPAIVDNTIYVGVGNSRRALAGRGGTLYAIDLIRGVVQDWFTFSTRPLGGSRQGMAGIACTPAVVGNRIYFSGRDGQLYCLDRATLNPVWITNMRYADPVHAQPITHDVAAEGWCSPLVVGDRVYVGWGESESNTYGFLYCLDAHTGTVIWLICTTLFPGATDNPPNVIPRSMVRNLPVPPQFTVADDPVARGGSPWSSCVYAAASNRILVGTGNVLPQHTLPQPKYSLGVLSVDATTGGSPRFFQPSNDDNYRPDDTDVDVAASPTVFTRGDGRRVLAVGSKNGSFFLLDAATLDVLARRQLLPRAGGNGGFPGDRGRRVPAIDPRNADEGILPTENFYGTFSCPVVHSGLGRVYVGVGGFAFGENHPGIDTATTPFLRALDWNDLTDAWATRSDPDRIRRYVVPQPPLYAHDGEAGFASPVLLNDVVMMSTSRPGMYAFAADTGLPLWQAPGLGAPAPNSFTLGPAAYGDYLVVGSANVGLLIYSL
jgi:outer membrane protein assembly factor BamB